LLQQRPPRILSTDSIPIAAITFQSTPFHRFVLTAATTFTHRCRNHTMCRRRGLSRRAPRGHCSPTHLLKLPITAAITFVNDALNTSACNNFHETPCPHNLV
jgi:hypothetical protein